MSRVMFGCFLGIFVFSISACKTSQTGGEDVDLDGSVDSDVYDLDAEVRADSEVLQDAAQIDAEPDPGPHSVGGNVSGLFGTGLVLQNNAGDDLAITENGSFVFSEQLPAGEPYSVTVLDHPDDPEQECVVEKGDGTVGYGPVTDVNVKCALIDSDGDGIPDIADPFPDDDTKPVPGLMGMIYAHTSSTLYTMHPTTFEIEMVGSFSFDMNPGQVTDVALDQYNVLYACTFYDLFVCNPFTAACDHLASLGQSFNGLTLVPAGTVESYRDVIIGISNAGGWYRVDIVGEAAAELTLLGTYGSGYSSSGDAYSLKGVGTFAAVNKSGVSSDVIVEVDPANGAVLSEIGVTTGYNSLYGLAGTENLMFGFDASGAIISIDPITGDTALVLSTPYAWWGAGISTAPGPITH